MRRERERLVRGDVVFVRGASESIGISKIHRGYVCTTGTLTEDPNVRGYAAVNLLTLGDKSYVTVKMNVYQSDIQKCHFTQPMC